MSIDIVISAIAIILALGGLIFFHELGHFAVARTFGMGVKAFSLGFGPKLFGFTSGKTDYKVSLIPLGGYVSLAGGEHGDEEDHEFSEDELFSKRPAWQKMFVVGAGPFFNFLLAFLIYWFLAMAQGQGVIMPTIGGVMPDSSAAMAGFQPEDHVLTIDGQPIDSWNHMVNTIREGGERELEFVIDRSGEQRTLRVTPKVKTIKNLFGEEVTVPLVGITQGGKIEYRPVEGMGFTLALRHTWNMAGVVIKGFVSIIERLIPVDNIGGPIMLAQMVHTSAQSGFFDLLSMVAVISINLAIINLLPIPVLDGGHIMFFAIETITRRPLNERWKGIAMRIGLLLLLMLMALAIFNDFRRILS